MLVNREGKKFHGEFFLYMVEDIKRTGAIINGYQVEQKSLDKIVISIIAEDLDFEIAKKYLTMKIHDTFDRDIEIEFYKKDFIAREQSGKLRVIKGIGH